MTNKEMESNLNKCLPPAEHALVCDEDTKNLEAFNKAVYDVYEIKEDVPSVKIIYTLIRHIKQRLTLKYNKNSSFYEKSLSCLFHVYSSKKITIAFKKTILNIIIELCKHKVYFKTFTFDWSIVWEDVIALATRMRKTDSIASAEIVIELLSSLSKFLLNVRSFTPPEQADRIVEIAMKKLSDTRQQTCVEGVLLLITCLPTNYAHYDIMLPQWIPIWTSLTNNVTWDACWLTLLCRARKHTHTFPWHSIQPILLAKAYDLLKLPTGETVHNHQYPLDIPEYYVRIANFKVSNRKTALTKIGKLLYYLTTIGQEYIEAGPLTITPPKIDDNSLFSRLNLTYYGYNTSCKEVNTNAVEIVLFYQKIRHFLYPGNNGNYTSNISILILVMISEMSHHMGIKLNQSLFDLSETEKRHPEDKSWTYKNKIHLPTFQYLCGVFTVLSMEGLFNKDPTSSFMYATGIFNLISMDPTLGHIILPLIINGLTAINQTHQAPVVLHTLNLCFKPLLYPTPIILYYLPELLQYTLPGLDPSDTRKTMISLSFLSTVLAYIPLKSTYILDSKLVYPPTYLDLIEKNTEVAVTSKNTDTNMKHFTMKHSEIHSQYDLLSAYLPEWLSQFLDKYFVLLEAQEGKFASANSTQKTKNPTTPSLCECIGYLFQALEDTVLRTQVETKILTYLSQSTPINSAKICGKMLDYMTNTHPEILPTVMKQFLTSEILELGHISPEKLAFRIRLLSGTVREATGDAVAPYLSALSKLTTTVYTQHTEKIVRKAANKLTKDILKGCTSVYPLHVTPTLTHTSSSNDGKINQVYGQPTIIKQVEWHIPSIESLTQGIQFLKSHMNASVAEIIHIITPITLSNSDNNSIPSLSTLASTLFQLQHIETVDMKISKDITHMEDSLIYNLKTIGKLLRGAAEILGDNIDSSHMSDDKDLPSIMSGRYKICSQLSSDDQFYVINLRVALVEVLNYIHEIFAILSKRSQESNTNASNDTVTQSNVTSSYASLASSASIRQMWLKTINIVFTRRIAWLKNADQAQKWLSATKKIIRSPMIYHIKRFLHHHTIHASTTTATATNNQQSTSTSIQLSPTLLSQFPSYFHHHTDMIRKWTSVDYWKYHDNNSNNIVNRIWVHYALRQIRYGLISVKHCIRQNHASSVYVHALKYVTALCGHEYQVVRSDALTILSNIQRYYGRSTMIHDIIQPALTTLSTIPSVSSTTTTTTTTTTTISPAVPSTTTNGTQQSLSVDYYYALGILHILRSTSVLHKVIEDWSLLCLLLSTLLSSSQTILSVTNESDKKEKLTEQISSIFVRYSKNFSHLPLSKTPTITTTITTTIPSEITSLLTLCMNNCGVDPNSGSLITVPYTQGIRYDTYASYILFHFIGHNDLTVYPGLYTWAMNMMMNTRGQPTVSIAYATLIKLVYIAVKKDISNVSYDLIYTHLFKDINVHDSTVSVSQVDATVHMDIQSDHSTSVNTSTIERNVTVQSTTVTNNWLQFLQGWSHIHPQIANSEGNAQWAKGINELLQSVDYLRMTFPRAFFDSRGDANDYSTYVRKDSLGFFWCLFTLIYKKNSTIITKEWVKSLLNSSKELKSNTEEEARANNAVRAEVFGGFYRFLLVTSASITTSTTTNLVVELEEIVTDFMIEVLEKCSYDYCNDWAEAISIALRGTMYQSHLFTTSKLKTYILTQFSSIILKTTAATTTNGNTEGHDTSIIERVNVSGNDDSFTRLDTKLLLLEGLINAEISTAYLTTPTTVSSSFPYSTILDTTTTTRTPVCMEVIDILLSTQAYLLMPYRSTRQRLGWILSFLLLVDSHSPTTQLTPVWSQLNSYCQVLASVSDDDTIESSYAVNVSETAGPTLTGALTTTTTTTATSTTPVVATNGTHSSTKFSPEIIHSQYALEIIINSVRSCMYITETWRTLPLFVQVLPSVLLGSGHPDLETAKSSHQVSLSIINAFKDFAAISINNNSENTDNSKSTTNATTYTSQVVKILVDASKHSSFHVRETVVLCASLMIINNWYFICPNDKKTLKDIFMSGLIDIKPEVQIISKSGIIAYLCSKTSAEMVTIAAGYSKNADILANREKQRRKQQQIQQKLSTTTTTTTTTITSIDTVAATDNTASSGLKSDTVYMSTIMMVSCIILTYSYDMPSFLPLLVTSLVKHKNISAVQETVMKTIQMFKRSHQDRWDDYKSQFSSDQLEDLQGVGAAHYFS